MHLEDDLSSKLHTQIRFLIDSSVAFDKGFDDEALRLATTTRVLLHDTNQSRSLLGQLGLLSIPFYSTAIKWDPKNLLAHHGLILIGIINNKKSYIAPLDDRPPYIFRWISFEEWWSDIIFDNRKGNQLTRKQLVLELANKEGGAHVDPNLSPSYEAIIKRSVFWKIKTSIGNLPLPGKIEQLSMRQIAHELIRTLERTRYSEKNQK